MRSPARPSAAPGPRMFPTTSGRLIGLDLLLAETAISVYCNKRWLPCLVGASGRGPRPTPSLPNRPQPTAFFRRLSADDLEVPETAPSVDWDADMTWEPPPIAVKVRPIKYTYYLWPRPKTRTAGRSFSPKSPLYMHAPMGDGSCRRTPHRRSQCLARDFLENLDH